MSNNKKACPAKISVGGQALIEGIMMQGPKGAAMSVRLPDGSIETEKLEVKHIRDKFKPAGWPIIRGIFNMVESLLFGYKCMEKSAVKAGLDDDTNPEEMSKLDKWLSDHFGPKMMAVITGISMVLGVVVGTLIDIDGRLQRLGDKLQKKNKEGEKSTFSQGFVTASLLFCVGAMTIVGSMNAGISGDNQMLYTKSVLDLISSTMLAASLGVGVLVSAVFVLAFQGGLVALSMILGSFLSDFAIAELVCAGSVMITALGLNLIGVTKIKVANLLPALIFVPFVCLAF
jgi:uncharacterized membrane protein YqgA involved in biofilm formation